MMPAYHSSNEAD